MIDPTWIKKLSLCITKNCKAMLTKQMWMVSEYTLHLDANHVKFIYAIFPILESNSILIRINIWILLMVADDKSDICWY